jgi:hypothetical protein
MSPQWPQQKKMSTPPSVSSSPVTSLHPGFTAIYATDLVYVPDCWKLCGDAHCCSFSRYKAKFNFIAKSPFQELPLLPGEYEFLSARGWLAQFEPFEHREFTFELDAGVMKIESLVSRKAGCPCHHHTRTTICRLYPFLPVFDVSGRLIRTERIGIYEEMEHIEAMEPACKVTGLPADQMDKFLAISNSISLDLKHLFYISAYRIAKRHVAGILRVKRAQTNADIFAVFENAFIRRQLMEPQKLKLELDQLFAEFSAHYGADRARASIFGADPKPVSS